MTQNIFHGEIGIVAIQEKLLFLAEGKGFEPFPPLKGGWFSKPV